MAGSQEKESTSAHETFEVIEHSDVLEDQSQESATAFTRMEKKVRELEQQLEKEMKKTKAATALDPTTLVVLWIDVDEINAKYVDVAWEDPTIGGLVAATAHWKADKEFQTFKTGLRQCKHEKAMLHDVTSPSQLYSGCLEPFDDGDANFARTPDGKLACQEAFSVFIEINRSMKKRKLNSTTGYESQIDGWKDILPKCEHIVVWHLTNDNYAATTKSHSGKLSTHDKIVHLGRSFVASWIRCLLKDEKDKAQSLAAPSESSTAKPPTEHSPEAHKPRTWGFWF